MGRISRCESDARDGRASEHLVRLAREAHVGYAYNEGQQELVLHELLVKILFYEGGRSQRCAKDVHSVVLRSGII